MQCQGKTRSGRQCKNSAGESGFCQIHTVNEVSDSPPVQTQESIDPMLPAPFYGVILVIILFVAAWLCLSVSIEHREWAWIFVLVLLVGALAVIGRAVTGLWHGILIDSRNKMSLSRLQLLSWTLIVFSGLLVAAIFNARVDWASPLNITIPDQLWIVMGLATTGAVAAPAILASRKRQTATSEQMEAAAIALANKQAPTVGEGETNTENIDILDKSTKSVVVKYMSPKDARWADLFKGEEVENAASVDTGKIQLFFLTFILILGYGTAIFVMLREPGVVMSMPEVKEGLNVLLGISQTGYLATKSIPHTEQPSARTR